QARDHLHHARLAGAVGPQKPESLAGLQVERDAVDSPRITTPVALAQVLHADHACHGLGDYTLRDSARAAAARHPSLGWACRRPVGFRSEEHTSELQSPYDLVCRLL